MVRTSFHGTKTTCEDLLNGALPKCKVTAPPPFTNRSNHPSSLVRVNPSNGVDVDTLTPTNPEPREVTTRPRMTAERLELMIMIRLGRVEVMMKMMMTVTVTLGTGTLLI